MSVIKKVIPLSDLKLCNLGYVVNQVAEYSGYICSTDAINDLSFCIVIDDDDSIYIISSDDYLDEYDLDEYGLSDPENLIDNAEYFTVRELIESVYSVVKLKKDLSDFVLYKDVESDLLYLF